VAAYFNSGRWLSTYEVALREKAGDIAVADEEYERRQNADPNRWGSRRDHFERECGWLRSVRYATLNLGNLGADGYGNFCLVGIPANPSDVVVLPANSAATYVPDPATPVLDNTRLMTDVGCWDQRGDIAVIKHANGLPPDPAVWADHVCRAHHYGHGMTGTA
jgi:hypothetical protein